jgi:hypothetical protein
LEGGARPLWNLLWKGGVAWFGLDSFALAWGLVWFGPRRRRRGPPRRRRRRPSAAAVATAIGCPSPPNNKYESELNYGGGVRGGRGCGYSCLVGIDNPWGTVGRSNTLERPQRIYQAEAAVLRAYWAGVTPGLVRTRATILVIGFVSLRALGGIF